MATLPFWGFGYFLGQAHEVGICGSQLEWVVGAFVCLLFIRHHLNFGILLGYYDLLKNELC